MLLAQHRALLAWCWGVPEEDVLTRCPVWIPSPEHIASHNVTQFLEHFQVTQGGGVPRQLRNQERPRA